MSSAGSSASSTASAPSYMSFGPRKGRRVAFQGKRIIMPDASSAAAGSVSCPDEIISRHKRVPYEREASNLSAGEGGQITPAGTVIYPCTFCGKKFYNPFIWRRHEVSAHAPQVQWVCGLDKPTDLGAGIVCPICVAQSGADSAACAHRFDECWEKPKSQRAFFRKDALKQHVRIVHCKGDLPLLSRGGINLDDWKEEIDTSKYNLTCHFCGFTCKTWNSRASHLTMHFVDQIPINLWIPGGPYALISASSTLYKSHLCPFPVSEILNGNMGWRCPLDVFDYSPTLTMSTQRDNIWECNLCGSEVAVGLVKTLFHLKSAHNHNNPCELSSPIFSHANEFFEHLITNHSAVRGDWMAELLLTTLQRYSG
ncbi:hypothetical protein F4680DRAFT_420526 [Xylaria scruposa]|nr:hypothetical protein F4680DRAFT_420526 [Xylaria scruposa]